MSERMNDETGAGSVKGVSRRAFAKGAAISLAAGLTAKALSASATPATASDTFAPLRSRPVTLGVLVFERMDQVDFTGPFAVLSRIPDSTLRIFSIDGRPVRDHKGLLLTPDMALADAPAFDVLQIPGGPRPGSADGQRARARAHQATDGCAASRLLGLHRRAAVEPLES